MPSTCVFGSTARKRADRFSDQDVLVVAPSRHELTAASSQWRSAGWSVAAFTCEEIAGMASRGSLFVQHLKQEGVILQDEAGFLASLLGAYRPKADYESDLADSMALLSDVSRAWAKSYWPAMCCADIAYGAVRNIAILRLASRGVYVFDYNDLLDHWAGDCSLSQPELDALRQLRILKHLYRARTADARTEPLSVAIRAARRHLGCIRADDERSTPEVGYRGLRLLELELVTKVDPRHLDALPSAHPLAAAWGYIRNPRGYPVPRPRSSKWLQATRKLSERILGVNSNSADSPTLSTWLPLPATEPRFAL